jgi:hypothetical protein
MEQLALRDVGRLCRGVADVVKSSHAAALLGHSYLGNVGVRNAPKCHILSHVRTS